MWRHSRDAAAGGMHDERTPIMGDREAGAAALKPELPSLGSECDLETGCRIKRDHRTIRQGTAVDGAPRIIQGEPHGFGRG